MQALSLAVAKLNPGRPHPVLDQGIAPGLRLIAGQTDSGGGVEIQRPGDQREPRCIGFCGEFGEVQRARAFELTLQDEVGSNSPRSAIDSSCSTCR